MSVLYFVIVGKDDKPLYEHNFDTKTRMVTKEEVEQQKQFLVHASLDIIEDLQYNCTQLYLPKNPVDKFNEFYVYGYVTPGYIKFIVLCEQEKKSADPLTSFFEEVHEYYVKYLLNPFYEYNSRIDSKLFQSKVQGIAKKYL